MPRPARYATAVRQAAGQLAASIDDVLDMAAIDAGAIDPGTRSFRDFAAWFREQREALLGEERVPRIAMFCTGGIRCEKSTSLLLEKGFQDVYHLKGGILKYLEDVPEQESRWEGECFVFDGRVTVGHGLREGDTVMCHSCGWPLTTQERTHPHFEEGVS